MPALRNQDRINQVRYLPFRTVARAIDQNDFHGARIFASTASRSAIVSNDIALENNISGAH